MGIDEFVYREKARSPRGKRINGIISGKNTKELT